MNKHLHTFESHNQLHNSLNPAFYDYEKYKDYMYDYEVASLVNQLNDMWWENEAEESNDERANYIGGQLDKLERQLKLAVMNADLRADQEEQNENQEVLDEIRDDVIKDIELLLDKVPEFEYDVENIKVDEYETVTFDLIINGEEEYEIEVYDKIAYLKEDDYNIELGNICSHHYGGSSDRDFIEMMTKFSKLDGAEFQKFLDYWN